MATEIPEGVEKSVADWLASEEFDFGLGADRKLVVGRTAFVGYMPTVEEIKEVHGAYDAGLDPVLAIYSDGGPGGVAEPGRGGKVDATLRYLVRYGTTPERAKAMTERLMAKIMERRTGIEGKRTGRFIHRAALAAERAATATAPDGDQTAYGTATVRHLAVLRHH